MLKIKRGSPGVALSLAVIGPEDDWVRDICDNSQDGVGSMDRKKIKIKKKTPSYITT